MPADPVTPLILAVDATHEFGSLALAQWGWTGVMLLSPKPGQVVKPPFRLQFHASGFNVSHSELNEKGSGHFRVRIKPDQGREEVITLSGGHTEAWVEPPAGAYTARRELMDNTAPGQVLAVSQPLVFKVLR